MSITTTTDGPRLKRRKLSIEAVQKDAHSTGNTIGDEDSSENSDQHDSMTRVVRPRQSSGASQRTISVTASNGFTKSSLVQMQLDEILEETRPDYDQLLREAKPFCDRLIQTIKSTPLQASQSLTELEKSLRKQYGIALPFGAHKPGPDVKYKFEYEPPHRIIPRGGLVQHIGTESDQEIEVAVEMPANLFQEKDYLNYRAIHKRACYTACIAGHLKKTLQKEAQCRYAFASGNHLVSVILVDFTNTSAKVPKKISFTINVVFPDNLGSVEKMSPDRNCLRIASETPDQQTNQVKPTPFYNSTIRSLATTQQVDELLQHAGQKCDAFKSVCSIGQTWLDQRGFSSRPSSGGFGLFEWSYMCALLLHAGGHKDRPLFSERYSTLQLFKAMLQVLASRDLTEPLLVRSQAVQPTKNGSPILYDGMTGVNIFSQTTCWSYELLKHQAQLSLKAINSRAKETFESTFITKVAESHLEFDEVYTIHLPIATSRGDEAVELYKTFKRGLGDRITLLHMKKSSAKSWSLGSVEPKSDKDFHIIEVHLLTNSTARQRLIDHGPLAEQQEEANDFRKFWGEKSELRRFRDGSITETLVWSSNSPVTFQILQYLSAYHFKILPSSITAKTSDLQALRLSSNAPATAEDSFSLISAKYQELSAKLQQMEGLPLPIRSVSPAHQVLRSASLGHPLDSTTTEPINILIQFDSSTRWPDHLLAIQHTKVAFLAKLSDLILESDSSVTTRLGLENTDASNAGQVNTSFLDIILSSVGPGLCPIVFRLRIHHERELQLLQTQLADKALPSVSRDNLYSALLHHKRNFVASPVHTSSLRNLITHFQPLSSTIRLLKSWIASHNLSNHVPGPALEIIATHIFLHPYPWSTPGNATTALLRCLHFLSRWDWTSTPLIVDMSLSQDMKQAQKNELDTRYEAWRKLDPNMNTVAWFVGTNIDNTGTIWTQGAKPARVIAARVTALAKAAISLIKSKDIDMQDEDWKSLFVSPISDFDFVIELKGSVVRGEERGQKNGAVKFKNLQVQQDLDVDSIGNDVVALYLADLEKAYANVALFFHRDHSRYIAGLWKPSVAGQRDWKVRLGYSSVPYAGQEVDDEGQVKPVAVFNKEAALTEMAMMGQGMIEKISIKE
ncbi:hypothetical protein R6Q59_010185 [Mikania micrantha]